MIEACLEKDPAKRPSAQKLLNSEFFIKATKAATENPSYDSAS